MLLASSSGALIDANGTKKTPSAKLPARLDAALSARRVLPMPPGPVSVISRSVRVRTISTRRRDSVARPTNGVVSCGKL